MSASEWRTEPAGGWSLKPQPLIWPANNLPAPTPTRTNMNIAQYQRSLGYRQYIVQACKHHRILARQIARSEHHIKARPLLRNGKAWR